MSTRPMVIGDKSREAIAALQGYVYQLYQSAVAWVELSDEEFLILEVAEDYAVAAAGAIDAVQVKDTTANVTLNSPGIISAIDSLVHLTLNNPGRQVSLRYLTTSIVGSERSLGDRVDGEAGLVAWRRLAKSGDTTSLRSVLEKSNISDASKTYIASLDEEQFRTQFLKRLHFDCGSPRLEMVRKSFRSRLHNLVRTEGGTIDQLTACEDAILHHLLMSCAGKADRTATRVDLLEIVQRLTRIQISQAVFDTNFVNSLVSAAVPDGTALQPMGGVAILPIPQLPRVRLERDALVKAGLASMSRNGLLWLHGATGLGKTLLARLAASRCTGRWGGANLRGATATQLPLVLERVADALPSSGVSGLIVDDLEHASEQSVVDAFQYLLDCADRADVPVIVTSSSSIPSKLKFAISAEEDVALKAIDFDEGQVGALVELSGGKAEHWSRYVYLASGGGHPQLAQALIQNLRQRGWPVEEMQTLSAFLGQNSAMADVRKESRTRLLHELPSAALMLLQRLSLHVGRFKRRLVLDLATHNPVIANAGFLLDDLVGPWLDQPDVDHYQTSPLLSGLATQTLSDEEQKVIHSVIADSLTRGPALDVTEMSSALISTFASQNEKALLKICIATITAPNEGLEVIGEHVDALSYLSADDLKWPDQPFHKLLLRAAQLLTATLSQKGSEKLHALLAAFDDAAAEMATPEVTLSMQMLIFTKMLISGKRVPGFPDLVARLSAISSEATAQAPPETVKSALVSSEGVATYGFAFLMQVGLVEKIDELVPIFEFIDRASPSFRAELLSPLKHTEFEADMYVQSPWLAEDKLESIDGERHSKTFAKLEAMARKWEVQDIAVACRKFRAIILDEYAKRPQEALEVLEKGLLQYGSTNSELIRAKAKVLHRSGDHSGSLDLARELIDQNRIVSPVERAFLGRDAAISAERQGDYTAARRYYLFARDAACESAIDSMRPMAMGLLADAALSSWQTGDRTTCLQDYAALLHELADMDPSSSLRAAHVRAVSQHTLLWLDLQASGELRRLANGEPFQIYPGCVSNPEPHPSIGEWPVTAIELCWYMLAAVECEAGVDAGIVTKLEEHLPNGPILEGQAILNRSRLAKAFKKLDWDDLVSVLSATIDELAYYRANGGVERVFNLSKVTYGRFPSASFEVAREFERLAQVHALLFAIMSVARDDVRALDQILVGPDTLAPAEVVSVEGLVRGAETSARHTVLFTMLREERQRIVEGGGCDPAATVYLAHSAITFGAELSLLRTVSEALASWYRSRWTDFIASQRFRLVNPSLNAPLIESALAASSSNQAIDLIDLVLATMPATNIGQQAQARRFMMETRSALV